MRRVLIALVLISLSLGARAQGCDNIDVTVDNQGAKPVQLQTSDDALTVSVPAGTNEKVSVTLVSYRDKICSVVGIKIDDDDDTPPARYVMEPNHPPVTVTVDAKNQLTVTGLNGPLSY